MSKNYVRIPLSHYVELLNIEAHFLELEALGIDNWVCYDMAEWEEVTREDISEDIIIN